MYPYFVCLFMTGLFFLFLAILFLPWIVVAPRKCANLINMATIMILAAFSVLKGAYQFLVTDLLCNKKAGIFAALYVLSLAANIYASMVLKNYLFTIISLAVEVVCLLYFVASYFPGGKKGMSYMLGLVWTMVKQVFSCCF